MKLELNVTEARLLLRLLHSPSTSNARAADKLDAYKLRKERDLYKRAFGWAHEATTKMMAMLARDKKEIEG
jgi:hypothetical protein